MKGTPVALSIRRYTRPWVWGGMWHRITIGFTTVAHAKGRGRALVGKSSENPVAEALIFGGQKVQRRRVVLRCWLLGDETDADE